MQKKVTIIGAGAVGSTTAYSLLARGAASEVVLIDINTEKALAHVFRVGVADLAALKLIKGEGVVGCLGGKGALNPV